MPTDETQPQPKRGGAEPAKTTARARGCAISEAWMGFRKEDQVEQMIQPHKVVAISRCGTVVITRYPRCLAAFSRTRKHTYTAASTGELANHTLSSPPNLKSSSDLRYHNFPDSLFGRGPVTLHLEHNYNVVARALLMHLTIDHLMAPQV